MKPRAYGWSDWIMPIVFTILAIGNATDSDTSTGWRLWGVFVPLVLALWGVREARRERRKYLARRQEWLTHFDRLMRDEVKRR